MPKKFEALPGKKEEKNWTREQVLKWAKAMPVSTISKYGEHDDNPETWVDKTFTFETDGTIVVSGDLHLDQMHTSALPLGIKTIRGDLSLATNDFQSLSTIPESVGGSVDLRGNKLKTLDGKLSTVGGDLDLGSNRLTSLAGLPQIIKGNLFLQNNKVTSIPEGIGIGGSVIVEFNQKKLKEDALKKGYKVKIENYSMPPLMEDYQQE